MISGLDNLPMENGKGSRHQITSSSFEGDGEGPMWHINSLVTTRKLFFSNFKLFILF